MNKINVHCSFHDMIDIDTLKKHPDNNNKHKEDQIERLSKIIQVNGWTSPITISRRSGYVTRGHARLLAAKNLKCKIVPVQYIDYESDEHEYADMTADNEIARWSVLEVSKVKEKILELDSEFDTELLGIKFALDDDLFNGEDEPTSDAINNKKCLIVITCINQEHQEVLLEEFKERLLECEAK